MKFQFRNDYPANSTRFFIPTIALRGFSGHPRELTLAWWTWKLVIFWHNISHHMKEGGIEEKETYNICVREINDQGDPCGEWEYFLGESWIVAHANVKPHYPLKSTTPYNPEHSSLES